MVYSYTEKGIGCKENTGNEWTDYRIDLNRHPIVSHCVANIPIFIKNET